jgi:hypothetical protein
MWTTGGAESQKVGPRREVSLEVLSTYAVFYIF